MIIIGDIHGCYTELMKLLDLANDEWGAQCIYTVGDLIDRGPDSKKVLDWAMDNMIGVVKGNHEDMMLQTFEEKSQTNRDAWYYKEQWYDNGGEKTMKSLQGTTPPEKYIDWMRKLPMYLETDEVIISHSGDISDNWSRGYITNVNKYHVFGHTPVKEPVVLEKWADIDTCCFNTGKLTALHWPSLETITTNASDFLLDEEVGEL